ncbi:MAG: hypothetical protein Q8L39_16205 [Burkholderiales bacterium]|nr:hypothetical protein [Burkholderiales bacterium]
MDQSTAFHQLGRFVFLFQHVEAALTELLVLMARADDEAIRILTNELEFSQRVKTTDVMFARFVDLRKPDETAKAEFHKLMVDVLKLGERRNELVHSKYAAWINAEGSYGLLRQNSALRASKGFREDGEEELLPEVLEGDGDKLAVVLQALERFRFRVIDWAYPE